MIIVPRDVDPGGDQAMKTLVASLADNKSALGRRYAEWAVSAPTLESAVAAAAMAQDELGHARSTYPVLKQLGVDDQRGRLRRRQAARAARRRAARLERVHRRQPAGRRRADDVRRRRAWTQPRRRWPQRAKKILQEEGSHRAHGEAWARRLLPRRPARRVRRAPAGDLGARRPLDRPGRRPRVPRPRSRPARSRTTRRTSAS